MPYLPLRWSGLEYRIVRAIRHSGRRSCLHHLVVQRRQRCTCTHHPGTCSYYQGDPDFYLGCPDYHVDYPRLHSPFVYLRSAPEQLMDSSFFHLAGTHDLVRLGRTHHQLDKHLASSLVLLLQQQQYVEQL